MQQTRAVCTFAGAFLVALAACNRTDTSARTDSTTVSTPPAAASSEEQFVANMDGLSERPTTVNTGATGSADLTITSSGEIRYTITVNGLSSNPTAAHIHGPADANTAAGPLVSFDSLEQTMSGTLATGTIDASKLQGVTMDSLTSLMRSGMAYVNVHTVNHKDGEIRGQIAKR